MTKPRNAIFTLLVKSLLTSCKNFRPAQRMNNIWFAAGSGVESARFSQVDYGKAFFVIGCHL